MADADVTTSVDVFNPSFEAADSPSTQLLARFITALRIAIWHQRRAHIDPSFADNARNAWAAVSRSATAVLSLRGDLDRIAYGLVVIVDAAVELRHTDLAPRYLSRTVGSLTALVDRLEGQDVRVRRLIDALMIQIVRLSDLWPVPEIPESAPVPRLLSRGPGAQDSDPALDLPLPDLDSALAAAAPEHASAH